MKTRKTILSVLTAALIASHCAISASAYDYTPYDIMKQIEEIGYVEFTAPEYDDGATYVPVRPADGEIVNYWDWDVYEGILIYCEDGEALRDTTLGDGNLTINFDLGSVWMSSLKSKMIGGMNFSYEVVDSVLAECLPEEYKDQADNLWVLNDTSGNRREFLCSAIADDRFEMLGILKSHVHTPAYFDGSLLYIEPAEGYTLETIDWDAISEQVGETIRNAFDWNKYNFYYSGALTLDEATALCDRLEACDEIEMAWFNGNYYPSAEYIYRDRIEVVPFQSYGTDDPERGDTDGNGIIQVKDAQLALQGAAAILSQMQPDLTDEQIARADADKDGQLTVRDAQLILRYYSDQTSGLNPNWETMTGIS